jgi:hypothetical protein
MSDKLIRALHAARLVLENPSTDQAKQDALAIVNDALSTPPEAVPSHLVLVPRKALEGIMSAQSNAEIRRIAASLLERHEPQVERSE